jgi:hypothetical protein
MAPRGLLRGHAGLHILSWNPLCLGVKKLQDLHDGERGCKRRQAKYQTPYSWSYPLFFFTVAYLTF